MTDDAGLDRSEQDASPMWTLWSAAYAYAQVMRDLMAAKHDPSGERSEYFDAPTMLIAYALAAYADEKGIDATSPSDLAELSGMELWERLETPRLLASVSTLSPDNRAVIPAAGEPAHELFFRMKAEVDRATKPGAALPDDQRRAKARTGARTWYERGEDGQAFVANMLLTCVSSADRARGVTSLQVITGRAEGSAQEPLPLVDPNPRPYELSEYMAADEPYPPRESRQWALRVVQGAISGQTLLLHYLTSILDRHIDIPDALAGPRKAGESAEAYTQRERLAKKFVDVHLQLADHAPDVAEELLHLRPSDAPDAVEAITREAQQWWTAARYDATIDDLLPSMTTLLDGLVAPERRGDVQDLLKVVTSTKGLPLARARIRITGAANEQPFEALHLAAALTAALWQEPACVPDPDAEYLRLATAALRLSQGKLDSPRAASAPSPQPSTPARTADARKKAARKTARKSRRQGRR
ncbi:hypothetical protein [Amycolatopsis sp. RTGN1]|uniref:hypothetical protein n=1 Tax=Amycolatopsis ponsaeliensis TaxID=2992142 RepID=UPI00254F6463|nr:hypothetical protein [Amycolatopsis sp. RTGN1]